MRVGVEAEAAGHGGPHHAAHDDDDDYNDDNDHLDRLMVPSPLTRSSPDPLWRPSLVTETRFRMLGKLFYSIHICQDLPSTKE